MRKDEWLLSVLIVLVLTAILIMVNLGQNLRSARETLIEVKTYNEHLKACIRKNNAEIDRLAIELSEKKKERSHDKRSNQNT